MTGCDEVRRQILNGRTVQGLSFGRCCFVDRMVPVISVGDRLNNGQGRWFWDVDCGHGFWTPMQTRFRPRTVTVQKPLRIQGVNAPWISMVVVRLIRGGSASAASSMRDHGS